MKLRKEMGMEFYTCLIAEALSAAGLVVFLLSYTTNYYDFGKMNSVWILGAVLAACVVNMVSLIIGSRGKAPAFGRILTLFVTALLMLGIVILLGDRVEGIGNCIVTDYDAGHGGEEAIYLSFGACGCFLAAIIINIIGSFSNIRKVAAD